MSDFSVDISFSNDTLNRLQAGLIAFTGKNGGRIMPNTKNVFAFAGRIVQRTWQNWAMGGTLAGAEPIKSPNPRLASSIKITKQNDFNLSIGTDSPIMERIQKGQPRYDMKETYPKGKKSRVSKKGVPYLIIPFRWNTSSSGKGHFQNSLAEQISALVQAKKFKQSSTTGEVHFEKNAGGQNVQRAEYNWGDRLSGFDGENYNGTVRMKTNSGSAYFTFRIISVNSPKDSWIKKEVPANNVVQAIEQNTRKVINDIVEQGIRDDLGF